MRDKNKLNKKQKTLLIISFISGILISFFGLYKTISDDVAYVLLFGLGLVMCGLLAVYQNEF